VFWSSYTVIILLAHCSRSIQSILFCKNSFWRTGKVWTYQVHVWIISGTFERLVFYFSLTELYEIGFCGTSEKIWIHDNDCHDLWHEKDFQNLGNDFEIVSREWVKTNLFLKEKKKKVSWKELTTNLLNNTRRLFGIPLVGVSSSCSGFFPLHIPSAL
jgi:hypothetical protein